jgi:hypothetical protein
VGGEGLADVGRDGQGVPEAALSRHHHLTVASVEVVEDETDGFERSRRDSRGEDYGCHGIGRRFGVEPRVKKPSQNATKLGDRSSAKPSIGAGWTRNASSSQNGNWEEPETL